LENHLKDLDAKATEINTEYSKDESADKAGILLSVICCLHCMAIPLLMVFAPSIGHLFEEEWIHMLGFIFVVPLGLYAFISKIKVHSDKRPLYIGLFGILFLILGHLAHENLSHEIGQTVELIASIVGGLSLVFAHILNIKLCRCNTCEH
jgi:hypothetical protein